MAGHTFFGKRRLCYTEVIDFTDFQGIGHDPLYRRYDSVYSVIKTAIAPQFQHFLAVPLYVDDEDQISWFVDEWNETPERLTNLTGVERAKYDAIKEDTIRHYRSAAADLNGEELQILACAIKYIDDDRIYCADGKVFLVAWGMTPDVRQHKVIGSIIHEYELIKKHKVTFDAGEHGNFAVRIDSRLTRVEGSVIAQEDLPEIVAYEGWRFAGWTPDPVGFTVNADATFTATYSKVDIPPVAPVVAPVLEEVEQFYNCRFDAGEYGTLNGVDSIQKIANTRLEASEIPQVTPRKGYKFKGWNINPLNCLVDGDKIFTAEYERILPWWRRWWLWLVGAGCFKWLLWFLLFLLTVIFVLFFLRTCIGCASCSGHHSVFASPVNGVYPIDSGDNGSGKIIDDNGTVKPITGDDGDLPDGDFSAAPVMGEGGEEPPIIKQPGQPDVIANRLFLFLEDENDDVDALARDFKKAYPGEEYSIIGFDRDVKLLVIKIPESERDEIRQTINGKIPNHKFIVFDEEIYELQGYKATQASEKQGWHLDAIHLKQGWTYTRGSADVKIAVVDDGIDAGHPMFKGRIVDAYNVYTQDNSLSVGAGHGTHTAGLAAGSAEFYSKGASGVAPNCKLMPVQVFDNGKCPLSALISGIMYSVHRGADVVNVSIGPSLAGLDALPVDQQVEVSKTQFRNVAMLWARVCKLAAQKRCILVFAAGNDDILTSIPPENRNASSIVVTAVDSRKYPTTFTNYGPCSDISAPGKGIYSSFPSSSFKSEDGTSMAAPIVTGAIALMKSIKKDLTVEQARNALYSTGAQVYGWIPPMVLLDKALDATKRGDFKRVERESLSVPPGEDCHLHSGIVPGAGGVTIGGGNDDGVVIIDDDGTIIDGGTVGGGTVGGGIAGGGSVDVGGGVAGGGSVDVGGGTVGGGTVGRGGTSGGTTPGNGNNYDDIRRQIKEHQKEIDRLRKLLPNNK